MVHGLPTYLYPAECFTSKLQAATQKGTFIVPGEDRTYLVHCDMAQHMEKGMRGPVGGWQGSGDLWGVPGVSDEILSLRYLPAYDSVVACLHLLAFTVHFGCSGTGKNC